MSTSESLLSSSSSKSGGINLLIGLPNDVLYKILTFIDTPFNMATILCHSIVPLCHATQEFVNGSDNDELWELVLGGYYLDNGDTNGKSNNNSSSNSSSKSSTSTRASYHARTQRRSSKRLRRTTAKEDVIHAHFVLRDQVSQYNFFFSKLLNKLLKIQKIKVPII